MHHIRRTRRTCRTWRAHHSHQQRHAAGFTLFELVLVVTIIGLLIAVAIPGTRRSLDAIAVRGAAGDVANMLELARHTAMTLGARVSVDVDSAPARLTMRTGSDTLRMRDEYAIHGVRFVASRTPVVYSQLGLGFGVSNLTIVVSRGAAAETVAVSRLGRVRR
jgi:prepilin-type N-terminal cleavage/methylation domain-containing protein